jgi:TusA-related sulfurtransferase
MTPGQPAVDHVLEVPGMACTTLTPVVAKALAELHPGEVLEVRTDDPAARIGLPAWCRLTRNPLHATYEGPDATRDLAAEHTIFHIIKKET